jgi:hypothetical protein
MSKYINAVECIDMMKSWAEYVSGECDQLKRMNTVENNKIYLLKLEQFKRITECNTANLMAIIDLSIDKTKKNLR